jgi:hypothetical protein
MIVMCAKIFFKCYVLLGRGHGIDCVHNDGIVIEKKENVKPIGYLSSMVKQIKIAAKEMLYRRRKYDVAKIKF